MLAMKLALYPRLAHIQIVNATQNFNHTLPLERAPLDQVQRIAFLLAVRPLKRVVDVRVSILYQHSMLM
jgi:hypothetical protein